MAFPATRTALATMVLALLACAGAPALAQDLDRLAGQWNFRLTWGGLVDDSGVLAARRTGEGIEMSCAKGCDAGPFLRGRVQGGAIAWEFWADAGVQSKCKEDRGWRPVQPTVSGDGRRIDFYYVMRLSDDCGVFLRRAPEKIVLTRD